MLFSPHVKTKPEDFYNYKKELQSLLTGIQDPLTRMIAVKGIRRIGKSSLLRVGLGMARKPYILFDVRSVGEPTLDNIYEALRTGLEEALNRISPLRSVISRIEGLEVTGLRVRIRERRHTILYNVFRALDEASPQPGGLVVAIDEAQYLFMIRGFPKVLAHVYDYMTGLKIVLTGSEVGLLDRLLGKKSPEAPLYGRPVLEIHMNRLPRGESVSSLEQGFQELRVSWSRENIEEAVDTLDGIPGWLTFYRFASEY